MKTKTKAKPRAKAKPAKKKSAAKKTKRIAPNPAPTGPELRGLRSCIYQVDDLVRAKEFYRQALGKEPYFGTELGPDPDVSKRRPGGGTIGYWRVADVNATWTHLTSIGDQSIELPHAVGVDPQTSIVADPFGNFIGLIQAHEVAA